MSDFPDGLRPRASAWTLNMESPQIVGLHAIWPCQDNSNTQAELVTRRTLQYSGVAGGSLGPLFIRPDIGTLTGFDGSSSQLDVNGSTSGADSYYDISGSFTLSAWLYVGGGAGSYRGILVHRATGAGEAGDYGFYVKNTNVGEAFFYSGGFRAIAGATTIAVGGVYHLACTWNESSKVLTIFTNGKADGNASFAGRTLVGTSRPLHMGYTYVSLVPQDRFIGGISDVRLYTRALTSQEVWALYDPATRWDLYGVTWQKIAELPGTSPTTTLFSPFIAGNV